jgi:hypothetical protein
MDIPFTIEQFLDVFERYNRAIGAAPLAAYVLGIATLALAARGGRPASRAALAVLGLFWTFDGAAYHLAFFREVNPAATGFGIAFIAQGALFAREALRAEPLPFGVRRTPRHALALALAAYAMVVYPLLGAAAGHGYPRGPTFGVAPCPTTIFTFAVLLLAERAVPASLFAIPFLWSLLGVSAAAQLGIREDYGLGVAGIVGTAVLVVERRPSTRSARRLAGPTAPPEPRL